MNTAINDVVVPIRPKFEVVERRVAEIEDGYTRLANALYDELIGADLTKNQSKVAHAICRKTFGYGKKMDRISDSQLAQLTRMPRQKVNKAKNELIAMKVITREGQQIGPNKRIDEWQIDGCHHNGDSVTKTVTKSVTKTVTAMSPKQGHTKETITKEKKENTPLPPEGGCDGKKDKSASQKKSAIDYQAVMAAYNAVLGNRLPQAESLNEKRRRSIKRLMSELKEPSVEAAENYFSAFANSAKAFYFGDNPSGWRASFDYLLRSETLVKTREGSL